MFLIRFSALLLVLSLDVAVLAAPAPVVVLPNQFAGWKAQENVLSGTDPAVADQVNATVLKEYGFRRLEKATYVREDGRKLAIKAAIFGDTSGAYGAFTYYKTPIMVNEKIGAQAVSLNNRVLFYQGNVLIDAIFVKLSAMSAAELRELAGTIPSPRDNSGKLPPVLDHLPKP